MVGQSQLFTRHDLHSYPTFIGQVAWRRARIGMRDGEQMSVITGGRRIFAQREAKDNVARAFEEFAFERAIILHFQITHEQRALM